MELQAESDLMAIIKMQPAFGKNAHLVWGYIELFGITPLKAKTKKIRILLEELKNLFDAEAFAFNKNPYRISQAGIADALNLVVHKHFAEPLENHNYLKKVMITIADREERAASQHRDREQREREDRLRAGYDRPAEQVEPAPLAPEIRAQVDKILGRTR